MAQSPVYADLPTFISIKPGLERLTRLRDTYMCSSGSTRFSGWNKTNLLRALNSKPAEKLGLGVFELINHKEESSPAIVLTSGQQVDLAELVANCSPTDKYLSPWLLFFNIDSVGIKKISNLTSINFGNHICPVFFSGDKNGFVFSLCCETAHFWKLRSCLSSKVTYSDLVDSILTVATAFRTQACSGGFAFSIGIIPGSMPD